MSENGQTAEATETTEPRFLRNARDLQVTSERKAYLAKLGVEAANRAVEAAMQRQAKDLAVYNLQDALKDAQEEANEARWNTWHAVWALSWYGRFLNRLSRLLSWR
ncbi:hypothetical protein NE236_29815 [Actinoallomurus purpureus]|uniref:hypothetical protein n=1 Tax=Actinoallomurus purpureus TaxID=478114 RepID=UPI002092CFF0|nr:hypothetical protein [Actinoallomurus purpureus]MCO6009174.1 hypothetical protein [Actinoallomurus purpureus]